MVGLQRYVTILQSSTRRMWNIIHPGYRQNLMQYKRTDMCAVGIISPKVLK